MKICPKCQIVSLVKVGKRNGKQRYRCKKCKHYIQCNSSNKLDYGKIYNKFCFDDIKYRQLAKDYNISIKTAQKRLDYAVLKKKISQSVKV